jgi:hypothetical protein
MKLGGFGTIKFLFVHEVVLLPSVACTVPVPEDTSPWIMPTVASHSYSPNVGEVEFRELTLYGVLRSSQS